MCSKSDLNLFRVCSNVSDRLLFVCGLCQVFVRTMTDRWWDTLLGRDQQHLKRNKYKIIKYNKVIERERERVCNWKDAMLRYSYGYKPFIMVGRMLSGNFDIQLQGKLVFISSVVVSMLASSAVDLGTISGQVIAKTMKLIFVLKTGLFRIRIMCPSGKTYVPSNCCFQWASTINISSIKRASS